jgi:hypothetical protein
MNSYSFHQIAKKWLGRASILVLTLAILLTTMVVYAREDPSGPLGDRRNPPQFLASGSHSQFVDPNPPQKTIGVISSIEDLDGLPCRRGLDGMGKAQVTYNQVTGEIYLQIKRCGIIRVAASS